MAEQHGRSEQHSPVAKPYAFVPIPTSPARREKPTGHDRYVADLKTGTLVGVILARSPVHVASGQIELTGGQPSLVRAHFRRHGLLTIPGASLKGAIRSIVEAISAPPSCLRITRARLDRGLADRQACNRKDTLCLACRMFGAMGYLGQVHFHDAVLEQGEPAIVRTPSLFAPRSQGGREIAGRKFYRHGELARGNVPLEVCPVNSQFQLRMDFENLSDAQLGLLLTALGQGTPSFLPKLGGAKPVCCGSVEFHITGLSAVSPRQAALEYDAAPSAVDIATVRGATQLVHHDNLQRLAAILAYPGEGSCPAESY